MSRKPKADLPQQILGAVVAQRRASAVAYRLPSASTTRIRLQPLQAVLSPPQCFDARTLSVASYLNALSAGADEVNLSGCALELCDFVPLKFFLAAAKVPIRRLDLRGNTITKEMGFELLRLVEASPFVTAVLFDADDHLSSPRVRAVLGDVVRRAAQNDDDNTRRALLHRDRAASRETSRAASRFASTVTRLVEGEAAARQAAHRAYEVFAAEQLAYHRAVLLRLQVTLQRDTAARGRQRQRRDEETDETAWRRRIELIEHHNRLNLTEAQCYLSRQIVQNEQLATRALLKVAETDDWVATRRAEKRRLAREGEDRVEMCRHETDERVARMKEETVARLAIEKIEAAAAKVALAAEAVRVERLQREEAMRRRQEDLARERAEKEEAQRQKLLREMLLKQHQVREKLEQDSLSQRKGIRMIESAIFGFLQRVGTTLFQYLAMRRLLLAAGEVYEAKVLRSVPVAAFNVHQTFVRSFSLNESLPAALFPDPSQTAAPEEAAPFTFVMEDSWEARARELQNDYTSKLQKAENLGTLLRTKFMDEYRVLKNIFLEQRARTNAEPRLSMSASTVDLSAFAQRENDPPSPLQLTDDDLEAAEFCFGVAHTYVRVELRRFVKHAIDSTSAEPSIRNIKQLKLTPLSGFLRIWVDESIAAVSNRDRKSVG